MKISEVPERKGFVIPDFIYDTFNLSLLEAGQDNDYYTIEELKVLVADKIKELNPDVLFIITNQGGIDKWRTKIIMKMRTTKTNTTKTSPTPNENLNLKRRLRLSRKR